MTTVPGFLKLALITLVATIGMAGLTGCGQPQQAGPAEVPVAAAEVIYHGGDILTLDTDSTVAEALAVAGGRILAAGSAEAVFAHRTEATEVIDLQGRTMSPGFIDSHSHYFNALLLADQVNLYPPPAGPGAEVDSIIAMQSVIQSTCCSDIVPSLGFMLHQSGPGRGYFIHRRIVMRLKIAVLTAAEAINLILLSERRAHRSRKI